MTHSPVTCELELTSSSLFIFACGDRSHPLGQVSHTELLSNHHCQRYETQGRGMRPGGSKWISPRLARKALGVRR